jgi:transposase-like protein
VKYTKKLAEEIYALVASGDLRIVDVCKQVGISEDTFYEWKKTKSEFSESLKRAEDSRKAAFKQLARSGLAKLLDVYEVEETTTEYVDKGGKPAVKSKKVTKRIFMPSATAVIFTLKNLDSDNFKDKQEVEHKGEVGVNWHETRTYEGGAGA